MARYIMVLIGAAMLACGLWAAVAWWGAIVIVLKALVAVGLVLLGIVLLVFGFSEIAGARAKPADVTTIRRDED